MHAVDNLKLITNNESYKNSFKMILNQLYKILNYKHVSLKNKVGLNTSILSK